MANVPPPIGYPSPRPTPPPLIRYLWLIVAVFGVAVVGIAVMVMTRLREEVANSNPEVPVAPIQPKRKNNARIVEQGTDGWFDVVIDDFPIRMRWPNRPARTAMSRSFQADESWAKDYQAYDTIAQGIAMAISGYWLNDAGKEFFAAPGNLARHADAAAGENPKKYLVKQLPKSEGRTFAFMNGGTEVHVASVKFLQRPDLVVGISVSARSLKEAKSKLVRALTGLKVNEEAKK